MSRTHLLNLVRCKENIMFYKIYDLAKISGETKFSEKNLAIVCCEKTILMEDDACHTIHYGLDEVALKNGKTVRDILSSEPVGKVESIKDFISYFGIKDRVRSNYKQLLNSIKEIGLDPDTFHEWK